jgi:GT2 family glycosyltransferase
MVVKRAIGHRDTPVASAIQAAPAAARSTPLTLVEPYDLWRARNTPNAHDLAAMRREAFALRRRPLITVITPVFEVPEIWLRRCIESVIAQVYPEWELCLVDDGSRQQHVARILAEYRAHDRRIRCEKMERNSGIIAATARALDLARGDFVGFLDHDDELAPDALFEVARRLDADSDLDFLYSDEDRLDRSGRPVDPFFKPGWSPDLLMSLNYVCHFAVYRTALVRRVGGLRAGFEGSQDWDLVLRVTEATSRIAHIPKILYHWRQAETSVASNSEAKPYAFAAGQRVLEGALVRRGRPGQVEMLSPGRYRVSYAVEGEPLVSIVIPTRDGVELLRKCIGSILERSTYRNFEILVLENESRERETLDYLAALPAPHRAVPYRAPFNWSAINNFGARSARGQYLLFLNNDTEVIEPSWIEAMLEHAQRPEVGVVGAKLLYADGSIQHAGAVIGTCGTAGHAFRRLPASHGGYFGLAQVTRNVSAVTGACMMVRREVFEALGGFDESYAVAYSDIDFCLTALQRGHRVIYTPHAALFHHECATRGALDPPPDRWRFQERWECFLADDPHYNPNLSRRLEDFSLLL